MSHGDVREDENADSVEAQSIALIAAQLARGKPHGEVAAAITSAGLDSDQAVMLVEAVASELARLTDQARQRAARRRAGAILVSGIGVFLVCWLASIVLGLLPDMAGKLGEKFGGHAIGAGVSFIAKETGHPSVSIGGFIGWATYFVSFLAVMASLH